MKRKIYSLVFSNFCVLHFLLVIRSNCKCNFYDGLVTISRLQIVMGNSLRETENLLVEFDINATHTMQ